MVLVKQDGTLKSPLKKLLSVSAADELLKRTGAKPGDLLLLAAGPLHTVVRDSLTDEGKSCTIRQEKHSCH